MFFAILNIINKEKFFINFLFKKVHIIYNIIDKLINRHEGDNR
jgi:hypothetical protein